MKEKLRLRNWLDLAVGLLTLRDVPMHWRKASHEINPPSGVYIYGVSRLVQRLRTNPESM